MVENPLDNGDTLEVGTKVVAGLGAANVGAANVLDYNVVTQLLGSSPEIAYAAIGVAGAVSLTEQFGVTEMFD